MLWPGFILISLWMALVVNVAHSAEAELNSSFGDHDLLVIQKVQFVADGRTRTTSFRLTLSIVPIRSTDTFLGPVLEGSRHLIPVFEQQKEVPWATSESRMKFIDGSSILLSPLLRLESKDEQIELRPRRHSMAIRWRMVFP